MAISAIERLAALLIIDRIAIPIGQNIIRV